jgi:hypothetical protein
MIIVFGNLFNVIQIVTLKPYKSAGYAHRKENYLGLIFRVLPNSALFRICIFLGMSYLDSDIHVE